jgi:hypothetical protein
VARAAVTDDGRAERDVSKECVTVHAVEHTVTEGRGSLDRNNADHMGLLP